MHLIVVQKHFIFLVRHVLTFLLKKKRKFQYKMLSSKIVSNKNMQRIKGEFQRNLCKNPSSTF